MNVVKLILLMVAGALLTCACCKRPTSDLGKISGSNDIQRSISTSETESLQISKGVTTQEEVIEFYGPPDETSFKVDMVRDYIEIWTYDSIWTTKSLVLYFDSNDTVFDYRFSSDVSR